MFNTVHNKKKTADRDIEFGTNFVSKDIMPDIRNIDRNIWNIFMDAIKSYHHRILSRFLHDNTTFIQTDMYAITISAKIGLLFLAGWEAFVVQNIIVQWVITFVIVIGMFMWLYSFWLTIEKKNLIFTNTSTKETKKWMKVAQNINLQHDINTIILRCFIVAAIFVTLFIIKSKL